MTKKGVKSCFSIKKMISTSDWNAEHPFAGRNTQHFKLQFLALFCCSGEIRTGWTRAWSSTRVRPDFQPMTKPSKANHAAVDKRRVKRLHLTGHWTMGSYCTRSRGRATGSYCTSSRPIGGTRGVGVKGILVLEITWNLLLIFRAWLRANCSSATYNFFEIKFLLKWQ